MTVKLAIEFGSDAHAYVAAAAIVKALHNDGLMFTHVSLFHDGSGELVIPLLPPTLKVSNIPTFLGFTVLGLQQLTEILALTGEKQNIQINKESCQYKITLTHHLRNFRNFSLLKDLHLDRIKVSDSVDKTENIDKVDKNEGGH